MKNLWLGASPRTKLRPINKGPTSACRRHRLRNIGIAAGAIALLALTPYKEIETKFFPVAAPAKIYNSQVTSAGIEIYVSFTKNRNCKFLGLEWYKGTPTKGLAKIPLTFLEDRGHDIASRPVGVQLAGPWLLEGIDLHELHHHSFAIARHECHPLWDTITRFY